MRALICFFILSLVHGSTLHDPHFAKFKVNPSLRGSLHKCSSIYLNTMMKYIHAIHHNKTILLTDAIYKISNSSGESVDFVASCLGI